MKLLVCALETSSNIHLKELLPYLNSDIELTGIFSTQSAIDGKKIYGTPKYDITQLAIMGFVDALKKLPFLLKLNNEMVELSKDVDAILLMDSSGFNLPLAKKIKKKYPNKPIIYYILPQAWAWKKKRIPIIEANCDKLCSIIPFEKDLYKDQKKIKYVGHPLLDEIKTFKNKLTTNNVIAFMPGSRKGEITKLIPIYKQIAKQITNKKLVLIIPKHFKQDYINDVYGDISEFTISNDPHKSLIEADFAFICSGTATLEASIIGTPFILNYIAKPLDYFIAKNIVKLKYIGLANIFFEKMGKPPIHKEYIQNDVTLNNLLDGYKNIDQDQFLENSKILREYLQNGSSKTTATLINQILS